MAKLQFLLAGLYATSALASPWSRVKRGGGWGDNGGPGGYGETTTKGNGWGYGETCKASTVTKTQKASTVYETQKASTVSELYRLNAVILEWTLNLSARLQLSPAPPSTKPSPPKRSLCPGNP